MLNNLVKKALFAARQSANKKAPGFTGSFTGFDGTAS